MNRARIREIADSVCAPQTRRMTALDCESAILRFAEELLTQEPSEGMVEAGAIKIANSPLIDAPKLPPSCWMGLSRSVLEAAMSEQLLKELKGD